MLIYFKLLLISMFPLCAMAQSPLPNGFPNQQTTPQQQTLLTQLRSPCKAGEFGTLSISGNPEYGWICSPVPPGYFSPAGATAPIPCPIGTISFGRAESCKRFN